VLLLNVFVFTITNRVKQTTSTI